RRGRGFVVACHGRSGTTAAEQGPPGVEGGDGGEGRRGRRPEFDDTEDGDGEEGPAPGGSAELEAEGVSRDAAPAAAGVVLPFRHLRSFRSGRCSERGTARATGRGRRGRVRARVSERPWRAFGGSGRRAAGAPGWWCVRCNGRRGRGRCSPGRTGRGSRSRRRGR